MAGTIPGAVKSGPTARPSSHLRERGFTTTLVDVVLVLAVVVLFLLFGMVASGGSNFVLVLPLALALASATVITMVLRDARPPRNPGVRQIPTDHLRRQMFMALRPRRPKPMKGKDEPRDEGQTR